MEPVFDPSAGNHVKGIPISDKAFLVVTNFNQLKGFMRDPEILQPNAKRAGYNAEELEEEAGVHELIQRALSMVTSNGKRPTKRFRKCLSTEMVFRKSCPQSAEIT